MPEPTAPPADFLDAVHAGLSRSPRTLPCRFFYDLEGSQLFEEICRLPEYYLTRAEDSILCEYAPAMVADLPAGVDLVELGAGSARKTRRLMEALLRRQPALRYVPVDISAEMLRGTAAALVREYPRLCVDPVAAEYGEALRLLRESLERPKLVLFLGSNLGNFEPQEAAAFLRAVGEALGSKDRLLLGLDLDKERSLLEAAYDDAAGVTARFNLNLLRRINRELAGEFDLGQWAHRAVYRPDLRRVEMHLVSRVAQRVRVGEHHYEFAAGETIHTENSHKYTLDGLRALAAATNLEVERIWTDRAGQFSLSCLAPKSAGGDDD